MPHPPIQVFLTTIASQPALRQRQDKQQLPGLLIGGEFPGTFQDFEDAVEFNELDQFLRLKEEWDPLEEDRPILRAVPVGIPGAYSPAQMNPEHISPAPSPIKTKASRREGESDAGELLGDANLHGVDVTEDDLEALVKELGLTGADAEDLVKGLSGEDAKKDATPPPPPPAKLEITAPVEEEAPAPPAKEEEPAVEKPQGPAGETPAAADVEKVEGSKPEEPVAKKEAQATADQSTEIEEPAKAGEVKADEPAKAEPPAETSTPVAVDEKA
ncbi:hypothetical protein BD309DRAFT_1015816 [Dichomitus squalens]|nr:hypothetical protein BD309DRAFT_1015816 [Dichomitus squalens]